MFIEGLNGPERAFALQIGYSQTAVYMERALYKPGTSRKLTSHHSPGTWLEVKDYLEGLALDYADSSRFDRALQNSSTHGASVCVVLICM